MPSAANVIIDASADQAMKHAVSQRKWEVAMQSMLKKMAEPASVMTLALIALICVAVPVQAGEIMFATAEKDGSKIWEGGGTIDLKGPVSLKVKNTLAAEHGFSVDTMKVKEVIKAGEEKTITVPLENIDKTVSEHKVYCQLHPKHAPATIKVAGK